MKRHEYLWTAAAVVALLVAATPVPALHPNHPLGFDPERNIQTSADGIDHVDLFSGSLGLTIPIGPFTLNYSSNVWRYNAIPATGGLQIEAFPDRATNAGLGWHLGWGEVYHASHGLNDTGTWLYVGDDGGRHSFFPELHEDDDNDPSNLWYTRDSSYLRLRVHNNYYVDIEFPDGTIRRYDSGTGGLQSTYFLYKVWSPFASENDPDVVVEYDREGNGSIIGLERTVIDRHGRTHHVHLTDQYPWINQVVTQVDLQGFNGQRMVFDFFYDPVLVNRSCKDNVTNPPDNRITVPHLREVALPDGTSYQMKEGANLLYYNECDNEFGERVDDIPGVINGINLPTGGKIRWSFQEYEFPPGDTSSEFNTSAGVEWRRLLLADDTEHGSRRYRTSSYTPPGGADPEVYTEVSVLPEGDCTKHFFNARYWVTPSQWRGWEYGLPFVTSEESGGKYLSSQVFTASTAAGACTGDSLRSTYLRYRHDTPPGGNDAAEWRALNRQVEATRVVYHDDGDRYVDTEMSEFDGLGNFRRVVRTGDFRGDSTTAERRETFVGYNRSTGVYPATYVPPASGEPWILGVFDEVVVTEDDALGESVARAEYGFDAVTGFLGCVRVLASGTARGAGDVLAVRLRDPADVEGLASDVKRYGGDNQTLSTVGDDCGTAPSKPDYWDHHEYDFGVRVKTTPRNASGVDGTFPTYDVDLDPASGWLLRQRDTAGYQTTYDYDSGGRLGTVTPEDGARIVYTYDNATSSAPPKVTETYRPAVGTTVLQQLEIVLDDFGRPRLERQLLADGSFRERETKRNARAWTTSVSEWGNLAKTTEYLGFDPLGRPATIRPPDGAAHDLRLTYLGDRVTTVERKIALAGGEAYVPVTREFDRHGRLRTVRELSGTAPEETPTTYAYDVGGRLTRSVSGVGVTQTRAFSYDNRGFLLSETHPEKGAAGNGTVFYYDHDSAGLPHRTLDGPHDLTYVYDFIGRLTRIRDRNQGNRLLSYLKWDVAGGFGKGKLKNATRYNYIDLPWSAAGEETVRVRQIFAYGGVGGSISAKHTKILWSLDKAMFRQDFVRDELGNLVTQTYPRCSLPVACQGTDANQLRTVTRSYANGWLTNVDGWTTQIDYHPSGVWQSVHHANGVVDHMTPDPSFAGRPQRLHTTGVAGGDNFDSGTMTYDGAGFVKAIATDTFNYDKAGRLASASYFGGAYAKQYDYDRFGNVLESPAWFGSYPFEVDSATNRLTDDAVYDDAGNLESWGPYLWRYDTNDQVVFENHMRYLYDAFGERAVSIANVGIGYENARFHLRDLSHRLAGRVDMINGVWSRDRDYVHALGRVLASSDDGPSAAHHYHQDHLGSTRLTTYADGSTRSRSQFMPYGEEIWDVDEPLMFTGHERDAYTESDYMHARHYNHQLGRFQSVDPLRGDPGQPQSLNRYGYAMGNPINRTDPDGRASVLVCYEEECEYYDHVTVTAAPTPPGYGPGPTVIRFGRPWGPLWRDNPFIDIDPLPDPPDNDDDADDDWEGGDDDSDAEEEEPLRPDKCGSVISWSQFSEMVQREQTTQAFNSSAHARLVSGTGIAAIFAPPMGATRLVGAMGASGKVVSRIGWGVTGLSGALYVADQSAALAAADSAARGPMISAVDPKCR